MNRVAILGAGPSGMAALISFKEKQKLLCYEIPELVCFEKQEEFGGMWNYTPRHGMDKYGNHIHNSMYKFLWSNVPKEVGEFSNYSYDKHFGCNMTAYPPREVLEDYIKGRANTYDIKNCIRFETTIQKVSYDKEKKLFKVEVLDNKVDNGYFEYFEYVITATGHNSTPNMPDFEGIDSFQGLMLHSHDFRDPRTFKGKDILIIGSSFSAEDIGLTCMKYGAKSITSSYRTKPIGLFNKLPETWDERPLITKFIGSKVLFKDGSEKKVDSVIMCTGYRHYFPFMETSLCLNTNNRPWPKNQWKGVCWFQNPKLFYIGMQLAFYSITLSDIQAWFIRDCILGKIKIPSLELMEQDCSKDIEKETAIASQRDYPEFFGNYLMDLQDHTDIIKYDFPARNELYMQHMQNKRECVLTFRDQGNFRSTVTGIVSKKLRIKWVDLVDDSMNYYIGLVQSDAVQD